MPRIKGSGVRGKSPPAPPLPNLPIPVQKHRRPAGYSASPGPVKHYCSPNPQCLLPLLSQRDQAELRMMRFDLKQCSSDDCTCICRCHTGTTCDGPIDRVHTPGHKPITVAYRCTPQEPCTQRDCETPFTNHRHEVTCHDRVDQTLDPRHWRKV